MTDQTSLLQFPCDFRLKIIGKQTSFFFEEVTAIVRKHFPDTANDAFQVKNSQDTNYLAITATVYVLDKATLDNLYQDLTQHPDMKMVL